MSKQPLVLLGVTGCIAAYKSCEIVRGLQKAGVRVKVVMTDHATEFVGPTTFRALTHEKVAVGLFDDPADPIHHISLAQECDAFLIAPCTANVMAKVACGIADDLLTTTALATTAPLLIAPAANVHMYEAPATQANMALLRDRGVRFFEGEAGYLACGDVGRGRLADPAVLVADTLAVLRETLGDEVMDEAARAFGEGTAATDAGSLGADGGSEGTAAGVGAGAETETEAEGEGEADGEGALRGDLEGKTVLITAGPTVEPIDAVRYISNYSSGKMGFALAEEAARRGADVVVVAGPVTAPAPSDVEVRPVKTARDMLAAAAEVFPAADAAIFAAAVADLRPEAVADHKLKKGRDDEALSRIRLVENPDVLATLAAQKKPGQFVVGFAAETDDVVANAQSKLVRKHADMIVANQVGSGKAFGTDDDEVWFVRADGETALPLMAKSAVAARIIDEVASALR